jgi:hypothetical protein
MDFAELLMRAALGIVGFAFMGLGLFQGVVGTRGLSGGKVAKHPIGLLLSAVLSIGAGVLLFVTSITHEAPASLLGSIGP